MNKNRKYLGNYVYIEQDWYAVRLCINRDEGKDDGNIIYMTPAVISNLLLYLKEYELSKRKEGRNG